MNNIIETEITERMKGIIEKLNLASDAYYNGNEIMSNFEYDALYDSLVNLEKVTGIVLLDSPTQKVGAEVVSELPKDKHEFVALSLDKTKDITEFPKIFGQRDKKAVVMWKMDGSTIQATYDNGKLTKAVTRGNGEIGSVITHNAPYIHGLPMNISYTGHLVVRGEAVMSYLEFERINSLIENDEEKYKNPRNLANASIQLLDSREMREREIWFHAFKLVYMEHKIPDNTFGNQLDYLTSLGFNVVEHTVVSNNDETFTELIDCMNGYSEKVSDFMFPVDGLVVADNDVEYAEKQPGTGHNPNKLVGYAFKWADETAETVLRDIEWSASRTGLLNPVAVFDSVELEGTTVSRASLHNVSYIKNMQLKKGNRITVYKANKIIPQLADNLDKSLNNIPLYKIPEDLMPVCPSCGKNGVFSGDPVVAICENPECPAKHIKKFVHFCERDCMNVDGLSEATIEKFVDKGWLKELKDIYTFADEHEEEIVSMDGFGKKSYENMKNAIEKSKNTDFVSFIHSLGIPNVGKGQAKLLKRAVEADFDSTFCFDVCYGNCLAEHFLEMIDTGYDFTTVEGFGDVIAASLTEYIRTNRKELLDVLNNLYLTDEKTEEKAMPLSGKTFVITGSLIHYANRDTLVAEIEKNGGKVSGSVSAKTSYLINNDVTSTSGKNKKAKELNIPIISEEDFRMML